jgi:hypothetical protein
VRENALGTLSGQAANLPIEFPPESIEIKVDWLPVEALTPAAFDCDNPSSKIYTETIEGECYANPNPGPSPLIP